jgi:nucleoside-diphosphate kinase
MNTVIIIKPDGVERKLVGEIVAMFEDKGMDLIDIRILEPRKDILEEHYIEHVEKDFYDNLVKFMSSGTIVVMTWRGENAVSKGRDIAMQVRLRYGTSTQHNVIHASDSITSAIRGRKLWFEAIY